MKDKTGKKKTGAPGAGTSTPGEDAVNKTGTDTPIMENREEVKRQLRRGLIRTEDPDGIHDEIRRHRKKQVLIILAAMAVVVVIAGIALFIKTRKHYDSSKILWTQETETASMRGAEKFGTGIVKFSRDSASYVDSTGAIIWMESIQMTDPVTVKAGNYIAVGDCGGTSVLICDNTGKQGAVTTASPISRMTISEQGMLVVILKGEYANYINFYDKTGKKLDIEIKTLLEGDGYPMDAALSPTGEQLEVSYVYVKDGTICNKVVFYNFNVGQDNLDRIVGGFEYESTMFPRVSYLTENRAVAFGDNKIVFYSLQNQLVPGEIKAVEVTDEICNVFWQSDRVGVLTKSSDSSTPYLLTVYDPEGEELLTLNVNSEDDGLSFVGDEVLMYNDSGMTLCRPDGKVKYQETFEGAVSALIPGSEKDTFILVQDGAVSEIELQ